jgi:hypothetical protein
MIINYKRILIEKKTRILKAFKKTALVLLSELKFAGLMNIIEVKILNQKF